MIFKNLIAPESDPLQESNNKWEEKNSVLISKYLRNLPNNIFSADVLLIGLPNSGKSLFLRKIQKMGTIVDDDTQETVGTDIIRIKYNKSLLIFREAGYQVSNTWEQFCKETRIILYFLDASNHSDISNNIIDFYNIITTNELNIRHIALICTKMDCFNALNPLDIYSLLNIEDILKIRPDLFITFISNKTEKNIEYLMNWIINTNNLSKLEQKKKSCCY